MALTLEQQQRRVELLRKKTRLLQEREELETKGPGIKEERIEPEILERTGLVPREKPLSTRIAEPIAATGRFLSQGIKGLPEEAKKELPTDPVRRLAGAPEFEPGERTVIGSLAERPGAALTQGVKQAAVAPIFGESRVGAFKKGFVKGSKRPEEVQTFEDLGDDVGGILEAISSETPKGLREGLSKTGSGLDVGIEPINALFAIFGSPGGRAVVKKSFVNVSRSIIRNMPKIFSKDMVFNSGNRLKQFGESTINKLGGNIAQTLDTPVGAKQVNQSKLDTTLERLTRAVRDKMKDPVFEIKLNPNGTPKPDAKNVWQVRKFIDRMMTDKDFIKVTKNPKLIVKDVRKVIAKMLGEVDPSIQPVMDDFSNFMDKWDDIDDIITDPKGRIKEKSLRELFSRGGDRTKQKFLEDVSDTIVQADDLIRDIKQFNARQFRKGIVGAGLGLGLVSALVSRFGVRPIIDAIEGLGGGGSDGGGGGSEN